MEEYPKGGAAKAEGTTSYRKYIEGCTKAARVSSKKNPLQKKRKEKREVQSSGQHALKPDINREMNC